MYMTVVDILATFDDDVKLSNDMKGVLGTKEENTKQFQILHATVPIADDKWGSYSDILFNRLTSAKACIAGPLPNTSSGEVEYLLIE
jgi:hypothetical protein